LLIAPANRTEQPRRFHAYCVGAAKTGTTTIAHMARGHYRAAHEPDAENTSRLVIDFLEQKISTADMETLLKQRDQALNLELEAAHPLGYLCGVLARMFPDARFIVTVREPMSWLKSRLNYHIKIQVPEWQAYRDYFWGRQHRVWAAAEQPLKELGLYSLDTYLQQYADHYDRVLRELPVERRLLLRTHELAQARDTLAAFLGVPEESLTASHSRRSAKKIAPLEQMDPGFIRDRIWHHCRGLITEFFPESAHEYQA